MAAKLLDGGLPATRSAPQTRPESRRRDTAEVPAADSSKSTPSPPAVPLEMPCIQPGDAGDHMPIFRLLRSLGRAPRPENFASWADEPTYQHGDRLVARASRLLVAHVHLVHRTAYFAGVRLPVAGWMHLACLPEYELAGYADHLVAAAQHAMRQAGAYLGMLRTLQPERLLEAGWSQVAGQGYSVAGTRELLAHLTASGARRTVETPYRVRLWRHVELDLLMPVYDRAARQRWGALVRNDEYWRWLVGRQEHDAIFVATNARREPAACQQADLPTEPILAYAVTHCGRIVELCCRSRHRPAARQLLIRACQEAIEQDQHAVSLHIAPDDPLHELLLAAGGQWAPEASGVYPPLVVQLLEPTRWVEALHRVLHQRLRDADLSCPIEIGFAAGEDRYLLAVTQRSSRLVREPAARVDAECPRRCLDELLLGNVSAAAALAEGNLAVADETTEKCLSALFPGSTLWQSPFDLL